MHILNVPDLHRGTGIVDHLMRTKSGRFDTVKLMRPADAIGIAAALLKSTLSTSVVMTTLKRIFDDNDRALIAATIRMYDGPVPGDHLWDTSKEKGRVHCGPGGYGTSTWQVKKALTLSDWSADDVF